MESVYECKDFRLLGLAQKIAAERIIEVRRLPLIELPGEELISRDDRRNACNCIHDLNEKNKFFNDGVNYTGSSLSERMIYFGFQIGRMDKEIMIYSPVEKLYLENSGRIVRVQLQNESVDLAVRDKGIQQAEFDAVPEGNLKEYLKQQNRRSLQLRDYDGWENPAFRKILDDPSIYQTLEQRIEYVRKFIRSLMK